MGTKLKLIVVTGLAAAGLGVFLIPNIEDSTGTGKTPGQAAQGPNGAVTEIPLVATAPGTPRPPIEPPPKPANSKDPASSTSSGPSGPSDPQAPLTSDPLKTPPSQPAPEARPVPSDITTSAEYQKAIQKLQQSFPDRSVESLAGEAKEIALRQFETESPRPLEPGETSSMREQHFVVKVRNGRGKARGEAAVNIEMRSEKGATPKDISFVLNFDPGMELLEAKAGPALIGRKSITTTPLSGGKVYIQVTGDTNLIQAGVFLSLRFSVVSTEGNTEIYPSQLTTADRSDARIGGLGAIMTIEP